MDQGIDDHHGGLGEGITVEGFVLNERFTVAYQEARGERTGTIYPTTLEAVQKLDALFDIERDFTLIVLVCALPRRSQLRCRNLLREGHP